MSLIELQAEKYSVIELLLSTNNSKLVLDIKKILELDLNQGDFYHDLTQKDKERIQLSIQQIKDNDIISHEEVMTEFKNRYKK